jgi:hypothetical protein
MDCCIDTDPSATLAEELSREMDGSAGALEDLSKKLDGLLDMHQEQNSMNEEILSALKHVASSLNGIGASIEKCSSTAEEKKQADDVKSSGVESPKNGGIEGGTDVEIMATIERIFNLDTKEQSFCAQVFVKMLWRCPEAEKNSEAGIPTGDNDDGDWEPEWCPKYFFRNLLEELYEPKSFYTPVVIEGKLYVKAEIRHLMKIAEPLELMSFPVDCQELSIELQARMSTEQLRFRPMRKKFGAKGMEPYKASLEVEFANKTKSLPSASMNDCHFARLIEERCILNDFSLVQAFPFNYNMYTLHLDDDKEVSAIKMKANLRRKSFYYVLNVWLVSLVIVSVVFCAWGLHPGAVGDRLNFDLGLILTLVVFRLVLADMLPKTSYMTWLDIYVMGAFMFLTVVTVLHSVFPFTHFKKIEMSAITLPPNGFDGVTCDTCEQDMIDDDTLCCYICAGIWVFFNLGFALYVCVRGSQLLNKFVEQARRDQQVHDKAHNEILNTKGIEIVPSQK